jgi:hypothetical protein
MNDREPDLDELGARLRDERPDLSPAAYERVHGRVVERVPRRRRVSRASIATTLAIAFGVLLTGGGASLAISGLASDSTAVSAQYAPTVEGTPPTPVAPPPSDDPPVGGQGVTDSTPTPTTPSTDDGQAAQGERDDDDADPTLGGAGEAGEDDEAAQAPVQVQVAEGGDELPFTGLAAIPIVLLGAALIVAGALLRRRVT